MRFICSIFAAFWSWLRGIFSPQMIVDGRDYVPPTYIPPSKPADVPPADPNTGDNLMSGIQQMLLGTGGIPFVPQTIPRVGIGSSTYPVPTGATNVVIECWGAGNDGGSGVFDGSSFWGGGGGGAGGYARSSFSCSGGQTITFNSAVSAGLASTVSTGGPVTASINCQPGGFGGSASSGAGGSGSPGGTASGGNAVNTTGGAGTAGVENSGGGGGVPITGIYGPYGAGGDGGISGSGNAGGTGAIVLRFT